VVPDSGATTDDLFEVGHRADNAGQHDVLAGGSVHPRRQELRRRKNDGRSRVHILETAQMSTADIALFRGDSADVVWVLSHEIGLTRPPYSSVPVSYDAMDAVRCQETVVDPLTETVLVDRIAEVAIGVAIVVAERCRGHAKLVRGLKVAEDLPPV